ncbi:flagellar hook-length control protein FliK, partial [Paenibacillus donghaensis]|nr:flagellar hook-length control protein FliK [Paenibacillus donghaensis]
MNISSLIRGLLGDAKPGDVKQLDMKTGQVVRGVVLSVSEDGQEAVVQIQGVKVRAALETPLEAGQATLLQVQPPGENGMMVLKPLTDSPNAALPIKSMADVLQGLGLADTDDNRALVEAMRASGIPLTKENAELLGRIMQQKPAGVPLPEWVQSAAIALQRGLPVTGESVRGLQQAVFGPPVHELLAQLEAELDAAQVPGGKGMPAAPGDAATANRPAQGAPVSSGALIQTGEDQAQPQGSAMKEAAVQGGGGGAQAPAAGASAGAGGLAPLLAKLQQVLGQLRTAPLTALAVQQGGAAAGA